MYIPTAQHHNRLWIDTAPHDYPITSNQVYYSVISTITWPEALQVLYVQQYDSLWIVVASHNSQSAGQKVSSVIGQ